MQDFAGRIRVFIQSLSLIISQRLRTGEVELLTLYAGIRLTQFLSLVQL